MLTGDKMPFCPGCGYHLTTRVLARAIEKLGLNPLDVIIVSDIGCCGLIDGLLTSHTVHGLHGRAVALSFGIAQGLANTGKKVVAFQGDGGATIGLQHLLEAARRNVDMTLLVNNNMVYGMTGGQVSGLSPEKLKEVKMPEDANVPPFDVVELAYHAGAAFSARILEKGDYSDLLAEAIQTPGFSLLEIIGPCPAHGLGKIKDIAQISLKETTLKREREAIWPASHEHPSLFEALQQVDIQFESPLQDRLAILLAGSAGEGVQSAAELLARAAVAAGLNATKKGEYPVTVGTGFSIAEVILSRQPIHYTGIEKPDVALITSEDGLQMAARRLAPETRVIIDESLAAESPSPAIARPFRRVAGHKGAALCAVAFWLAREHPLPQQALAHTAESHKHAEKLIKAIEAARTLAEGTTVASRSDSMA